MNYLHQTASLFLLCATLFFIVSPLAGQSEEDSISKEDKAESENPSGSESAETETIEEGSGTGSAMPPKRDKAPEVSAPPEEDLEELREIEIEENIGPDPSRLLEDPLILKTEKDRKRELIQKHMDLASQILNSWTIPLLGRPLAYYAEEEERLAQLEAFKRQQQRQLEALKKVDKEYYQERREEYYDTVIQAQGDRWNEDSNSTF
jgi:hypothetical protein